MDIYGVIGCPIKHSLSPAMHNAAFKALGMDAGYRRFEVGPDELEDFLFNRKDVVGFNVTVPHKVRAREILEGRFPSVQVTEVQVSGAINTVKRCDNKLLYLNTDVYGFRKALTEDLRFEPEDKDVLLIGCGGAGRAIVAGLVWETGDVTVNRIHIYETSEEARISAMQHFSKFSCGEKLEFISDREIPDVIGKSRLLVNAATVGMKEGDNRSVIDKDLLHKDLSVFDLVYNRETQLIKDARSLELPVVNGLGMLLYQGAHAFEFWTGKRAPVDAMREALLQALR